MAASRPTSHGKPDVIIPQYVDEILDDEAEREPVRYLPPDGGIWPPVPKWDRALWSLWLTQHEDWTPQAITQYLDVDRYRYGLGLQRHPKEPYTYFYLPVPAAVPMHSSKVPNLCYGGAVGGTKSHSTRFDAYRHLLSVPDYNAILMRRTHEELKRNHTNPALKDCAAINDFFQQTVMDLVPSEHELRFPLTRGLLTFGHCQNVGDEEKYLGPEYDEFRPDEMATFEKQQIIGVAGRLRSVKHGEYGQVAARLIGTTNPGPSWIKQMFIDKTVPKHENPRYKPDHYLYIPAKLYDNPYLMDEDGTYTTYEDRLYAYSPQRRKQLLDGNWDAVTGQFFPEWSRDLHVGVLNIPAGCKFECWLDWGYSPNPGVCHWVASFPNGRLYVFAEWVFNGEGKQLLVAAKVAARIAEITRGILKETHTRWNKTIGDPSMWAKDGHSGESYEETFRRNGVRMLKADNDRVQGWGRLRHWLQRHPEGGAWIMFSPDCSYAIRTVPTLVHDKNDPDDCDTSGEDHSADCLRYGVMGRPSPTKYVYRPSPSIPDNIAAMIGSLNTSNVRPFGKLR